MMITITLTKRGAIELLNNMSPEQRDLNWNKVYKYRRLMNFDLFEYPKGSPIRFCKNATVKNGQHLIMAFLLSKLKEIEFAAEYEEASTGAAM